MTKEEKTKITEYREQGYGYKKIGTIIGLSPDTIKTFCRRNNINPKSTDEGHCLLCGSPLELIPGKKPKKFCSDQCRNRWWNTHLDQVKRKAVYYFTCPTCKKTFTVYGNTKRKYCCHACYIEDRFGGDSHER